MTGKLKYTQRLAIVDKPDLTEDEFETFANDPHPKIRMRIAQRADATQTAINRLAKDTERNIRIVIAQHKSISTETLEDLIDDPSSKVRARAARNKNIGPAALKKLSKQIHCDDKRYAAKNWQTPFASLEILASDDNEFVRNTVAKNIKTPAYIIDFMLNDENQNVLNSILKRQDLSENQLLNLSRSQIKIIRQRAYEKLLKASSDQSEHSFIENMSRDEDNYIRGIAARSNHISKISLLRLANDKSEHVRHCAALHPNLSLKVVEKLSTDEHYSVRRSVAKNPNCPPNLLKKLSFDVSGYVRREVASNKSTSLDVLKKFIMDPDAHVRSSAVSNKTIPTTWLRENFPEQFLTEYIQRILKNRDNSPSRQMRASNSNTSLIELRLLSNWDCDPEEVRKDLGEAYERHGWSEDGLRKRAKFNERYVLHSLTMNPSLPLEVLYNICKRAFQEFAPYDVHLILPRAMRHPNMTRRLLDKIATCVDELTYSHARQIIKKLISANPKSSPEILTKIAASNEAVENVYMRASIAFNPSTPEGVLIELAKDKEFIVKFRLVQRENIPHKIGGIFMSDPVMAEIYQERLNGGYETPYKNI